MVISSTGFSFVDNAMLYSATDSSKIIVPAALSGVWQVRVATTEQTENCYDKTKTRFVPISSLNLFRANSQFRILPRHFLNLRSTWNT